MTDKELQKMEELKAKLKVLADEIRLGEIRMESVVLLKNDFYKLSLPYRKLKYKEFKLKNSLVNRQIQKVIKEIK